MNDAISLSNPAPPRHAAFVRVTHWITAVSFLALLISGVGILISHPRFYWGETGNSLTTPLFQIPIPASRSTVPTGYAYGLPDQNGWSRYLHFQAAWAVVITGLIYAVAGFWTRHFRDHLLPTNSTGQTVLRVIQKHLRLITDTDSDALSYNVVQRAAYLTVIFILFPLVILTGLAMSPAFNSAVPVLVNGLGGRQSARTLHFFVSGFLLLFLVVHVAMVILSGFRTRMQAMITGNAPLSVLPKDTV